jgi:SAM-dependent methyltransferase
MRTLLRNLAKGLTPPYLWNAARSVAVRLKSCSGASCEKSAAWYDQTSLAKEAYRVHYTGRSYYFLWCIIVDRIMQAGTPCVLEVGCGTGQLAVFLRDKGLRRYCGFDFSEERINRAKSICPEFDFVQADAFETDLFESFDYEVVVCCEFLRHVERDLEIVERVRPGARFLGTQRNFPVPTRERNFAGCSQMQQRYQPLFSECRVDSFPADGEGRTYYLLDGIRS